MLGGVCSLANYLAASERRNKTESLKKIMSLPIHRVNWQQQDGDQQNQTKSYTKTYC